MTCINCYGRKAEADQMRPCERCGIQKRPEQLRTMRNQRLCSDCAAEALREQARKECAFCHRWMEDWEKKFEMPNGRFICENCHSASPGKAGARLCARCQKTPKFPFFAPDGKMYCENCVSAISKASAGPQPLLARVVNRIRTNLR